MRSLNYSLREFHHSQDYVWGAAYFSCPLDFKMLIHHIYISFIPLILKILSFPSPRIFSAHSTDIWRDKFRKLLRVAHYEHYVGMQYCLALIFRGSKFSQTAVFKKFVEIISRIRCSIRRQCGSTSKCKKFR